MTNIETLIKKLKISLPEAMIFDQYEIHKKLDNILRNSHLFPKENLKRKLYGLCKRLNASIDNVIWRIENRPDPNLSESLPIFSKKDEIIDKIIKNQVIILSGETGSGKSTQIPKLCLAAKRGILGKIGCTQPRRIGAITIANRIAQELLEETGKSVGYKIRFNDKTSKNSFIKVMTDGILLAETQHDQLLSEYDTLIVDEAHERSLNIDFVLGILKTLLKKRKDLKLIITSATIDTEKFSEAFDNAPVIEVSGRMYPVELKYFLKDLDTNEDEEEQTHIDLAVKAFDKIWQESISGDILIFMPTEQDIRDTCEVIEGRLYRGLTVLPLYSRLTASEQSRIFLTVNGRKVIVATNIAETSITIPGVRYVIDTGLARILQYLPKSRTTSLPVVPISKSSANQRKGRCGRVENGVCIRLYSEEDFENRILFTPPEILRANLSQVILRMIALKLGDISDFPFINKPGTKNVKDGFDLLIEIGAITYEENKKKFYGTSRYILTEKGKIMARMPIDPMLSRMLLQANEEGCLEKVCVIAAALSIQDPRERPSEKAAEADQMHAVFHAPSSDFMTLINIWDKYHEVSRNEKSTNQLKKFCRKHYISFRRMREWQDVFSQIKEILDESGLSMGNGPALSEASQTAIYNSIHRSILSGFLSNIAVKKDKNAFQAAKGKDVMIFPGSSLFNKAGAWIVAAEMIETSRLFARTVANIEPEWLETIGKEQCKYTCFEPHWEKNRGEVVAFEQVSLYGLVIVSKRSVSYGRINPDEASEIFIRKALVEGDIKIIPQFLKHNIVQIEAIKEMEYKIRRHDLLVSDEDIYQFYAKRLGFVYDVKTLNKKIKDSGGDDFLKIQREDLLLRIPDENELSLYPDHITFGDQNFRCKYQFEPGKSNDGVTVNIPLPIASAVPAEQLDWIVPGFIKEKVELLIKGLPKSYRKKLLPLSKSIEIISNKLYQNETSLIETSLIDAITICVKKYFDTAIPASAWQIDSLPDHLKIRIAITGPKGEELCSGRDKSILKQQIKNDFNSSEFEAAKKLWEKNKITCWDFGDIPESIPSGDDGVNSGITYPKYFFGLEKQEDQTVSLRLFNQKNIALSAHKEGVMALYRIKFSSDLKFLKKSLSLPENMKAKANYFGGFKAVENQIIESVIINLFYKGIRKQIEFEDHTKLVAPVIQIKTKEKLKAVLLVIEAYSDTMATLYCFEKENKFNNVIYAFLEKLREELDKLVPQNFISLYENERLKHLVRYIKTIEIRAKRGIANFEKDLIKSKEINVHADKLSNFLKQISQFMPEEKKKVLEEYFWLIEEYKVSIFAQELKTPFPISKKRLEEKLREVESMV